MIEREDLRTLMSSMHLPVNHVEMISKPFIYIEYDAGNLTVSDAALATLAEDEMRFALAYAYRYGKLMPDTQRSQTMGRELGQHAAAFVFGLTLVSLTFTGTAMQSPPILLLFLFWVGLTIWSLIKMIWTRQETRFLEACSFAVGRTLSVRSGLSYFRKSLLDPLSKRNSPLNALAFRLRSALITKFESSFTGIG